MLCMEFKSERELSPCSGLRDLGVCVILARVMVTRVHVIKCSEALHWLNDLLRGLRVAVLLFLSPMGAGVSWFFGQYQLHFSTLTKYIPAPSQVAVKDFL